LDPKPDPNEKRTVLREPGLEEAFQRLYRDDWDEVERRICDVETVLLRDPEMGMPVGEGVWILPLAPAHFLSIYLYYVFYSDVLVLLEVEGFLT